MLKLISKKVINIRHNLSSLDDQPVGKAALTILIFLDLFILISIFDGLSDHTRQLTSPSQLVPQYCRDIVIEGRWNESNRLTKLARVITESRGGYYIKDKRERSLERHPACSPITQLLFSIEDDGKVSKKLKQSLDNSREMTQINSTLKRINSAYDTSLLEDIAERRNNRADVDSLRKDVSQKTSSLDRLTESQRALEFSLNQDKQIRELFAIVDNLTEADRDSLRSDLRKLNFWYPVKRLGMEMIFLLPLFLIFYFWNKRSLITKSPFQALVSSHLLVIVFIPVLIKITELIYDILPKKLLKQLIDLLESLKLVALWHYLMMAAIILAALALIYLFQKKLFSKEKLMEKRISNGSCQNCGRHLPANAAACPFCGFEQFKQCGNCGKATYVFARFCKECGQAEPGKSTQ
jgi:hypothetical protein